MSKHNQGVEFFRLKSGCIRIRVVFRGSDPDPFFPLTIGSSDIVIFLNVKIRIQFHFSRVDPGQLNRIRNLGLKSNYAENVRHLIKFKELAYAAKIVTNRLKMIKYFHLLIISTLRTWNDRQRSLQAGRVSLKLYKVASLIILDDPEVTANLYCNFASLFWEGCVICIIYLR